MRPPLQRREFFSQLSQELQSPPCCMRHLTAPLPVAVTSVTRVLDQRCGTDLGDAILHVQAAVDLDPGDYKALYHLSRLKVSLSLSSAGLIA